MVVKCFGQINVQSNIVVLLSGICSVSLQKQIHVQLKIKIQILSVRPQRPDRIERLSNTWFGKVWYCLHIA